MCTCAHVLPRDQGAHVHSAPNAWVALQYAAHTHTHTYMYDPYDMHSVQDPLLTLDLLCTCAHVHMCSLEIREHMCTVHLTPGLPYSMLDIRIHICMISMICILCRTHWSHLIYCAHVHMCSRQVHRLIVHICSRSATLCAHVLSLCHVPPSNTLSSV